LIESFKKNNIPSAIYYKYPIHMMKAFKYLGYKDIDFPVSLVLSKTIVSLPMHPYLDLNDIEKIVSIFE
jgi:dTDP-4-amino-4,6-dideoxygalactose transaminase